MAFRFVKRACGYSQEAGELLGIIPAEPLGGIASRGAGGFPYLIAVSAITQNRAAFNKCEHLVLKSMCKLPRYEIFKAPDDHGFGVFRNHANDRIGEPGEPGEPENLENLENLRTRRTP
jgi:hypothetical protein